MKKKAFKVERRDENNMMLCTQMDPETNPLLLHIYFMFTNEIDDETSKCLFDKILRFLTSSMSGRWKVMA